jgi:undecaprenyl diphosphate synthase
MAVSTIPKHVAIIPDGNRRWAKSKGRPVAFGHAEGYKRIRECITYARNIGVEVVTVWAFSTENWKRKEDEVGDLMDLIAKGLSKIHRDAKKEKSRVVHIGRRDRLGNKITKLIDTVEEETKKYKGFTLCLAIDYGGEDEVMRAESRKLKIESGKKELRQCLDTSLHNIPDPDLIIRTGGEHRTSGFMPMQSAYAEWVFEDTLFPDFDTEVFQKAIDAYATRSRRFGK